MTEDQMRELTKECGLESRDPPGLGDDIPCSTARPRYKLVARVSTATLRAMVAAGDLRSRGWTSEYRRPGNTVPVVHRAACLALFGPGDDIFLCDLPPR